MPRVEGVAACSSVGNSTLAARCKTSMFAGEDSDGVERRRQRHDAGDGDDAVRRSQAPDAAVARRDADRAAGVGAEREIDQAAGDGGGGAAGGAAGHTIGGGRVERRAVEMVFTEQAEGDFVGDRFAFAPRTGGQQLLDANGVNGGGRMRGKPGWIAAAGAMAGDVDQIFDGERETIERAAAGWRQREVFDERAGLFGSDRLHRIHFESAGVVGVDGDKSTVRVYNQRPVSETVANHGRKFMTTRNTRLGLWFFGVYLVLYGGFVLLAAFSPETHGAYAVGRREPGDLVRIRFDRRGNRARARLWLVVRSELTAFAERR